MEGFQLYCALGFFKQRHHDLRTFLTQPQAKRKKEKKKREEKKRRKKEKKKREEKKREKKKREKKKREKKKRERERTFRLSKAPMYLIITLKLLRLSNSSPRSCKTT